MAPSHYSFVHKTKLFIGALALEQIPPELDQIQARKPLVITNGDTKREVIKALAGAFARTVDPITVFDRTPRAVDEKTIREIVDVYNKTRCNSILALGGSEIIDTAKGVTLFISQDDNVLSTTASGKILSGTMPPFYAIPTMADPEASITMSVKIASGAKTHEFVSPLLMPKAVFVDSRAMVPASGKEVAKSGMAAMFRAVEAATGPQQNPVCKAFAVCALEMLGENLVNAVNSRNKKLQAIITSASVLSDIALSNTTQGLGLTLSQAVSRKSGAAQGVLGAILLSGLMKSRIKASESSLTRLLLALSGPDKYVATPASERAQAAITAIENISLNVKKASGLKFTLAELGATSGMDEIARTVASDSEKLGGESVSEEQILEMLKAAA